MHDDYGPCYIIMNIIIIVIICIIIIIILTMNAKNSFTIPEHYTAVCLLFFLSAAKRAFISLTLYCLSTHSNDSLHSSPQASGSANTLPIGVGSGYFSFPREER